jgi:hypothetical protein
MKRGRDSAEEEASSPAAAATKKTQVTRADGDAAAGIALLPTSALSLVWSYAVNMDVSDDVCANAEHLMFQINMYELQLVCRSWRETIQEMLREKLRGVAILDVIEAAKAHKDDAAASPLVLTPAPFDANATITDVRVVMGDIFSGADVNDRGIWMEDEQPLIAVRVQRDYAFHKTQPDIDWEATLKAYGATITRLDLSRVLLYTPHLGNLLRAAATLCPNVKSLILPPTEKKFYKKEEIRVANMEALSAAMKAWHGSNGGLTHLRVPYLGVNNLLSSVMFVNDVAQYCPDMEHLDGWRFTFIEQANLEFVTCDDFWITPPELFSKLWTTCTKLKSFNTVVLPFSEEFYAELADVEKPALEDLTLSFNSLRSTLADDMDSSLFQSITECTPGLRSLTIMCGETNEEEWKAANAFDDAFFTAVAKNCPKLEKLSVKSFADLDNVTVASLAALFALENLQKLSIRSMLNLDESFVDLLKTRMQTKRNLRMQLTVMRVRDMMWKVLSLVAAMTPADLEGVSLSLTLKTHDAFGFVIAKGDDQNARCHEREHVQTLVDEIKQLHGSTVRVHLHTTLPSNEHDSKCVLFDSLELSINDPQGFCCTRDKSGECGMDDVEQELCGDAVRADGVYERDPAGALEDLEYLMYRLQRRPRKVFYPGLMSDDDDDGEGGDEFGDELDGGFDVGGMVFADDGDDDEEEEEEDEDEDEGDDGDGEGAGEGDIFGNGEEDDEDEGDEDE